MTSHPRTRINITGIIACDPCDTHQAPPPVTPFCKVCFDAKKTHDIYTSHYVRENRNRDSKVVCPTLTAQTCNYCHKNGHSIGYCPKLAGKGRNGNVKRGNTQHLSDSDIERELADVIAENDFEHEQQQEIDEFEAHLDNQYFDPNSPYHPDLVHYSHGHGDGDGHATVRNFWNPTTNSFQLTDLSATTPVFYFPVIPQELQNVFTHEESFSPSVFPEQKRRRINAPHEDIHFDHEDDAEVCAINNQN